jgi:NAD(P)-dependent dehydrogenase (short-subunit alcohol dehydrogenase family)
MKRLEGKIALITGGASGIGLAAAELMAKEGAKAVIADYNAAGAEEAAAHIRSEGGEAASVFLDASQEESIREAVAFAAKQYGGLNVLHNNVGVTNLQKDLDVLNIDLNEWDRLMNINAKSVLLGSRFAIPYMIEASGGSIVNTSSMAAFAGDSLRSAYGASKAAVVNLTRYIAAQYGKHRIRCNAVAPGLIAKCWRSSRSITPFRIMAKRTISDIQCCSSLPTNQSSEFSAPL